MLERLDFADFPNLSEKVSEVVFFPFAFLVWVMLECARISKWTFYLQVLQFFFFFILLFFCSEFTECKFVFVWMSRFEKGFLVFRLEMFFLPTTFNLQSS